MRNRVGQTVTEYAVLLTVVTAAALGMQVYSKRAVQAAIKRAADQMASGATGDASGARAQVEGGRLEAGERTEQDFVPGDVLASGSGLRTVRAQTTTATVRTGGQVERRITAGQDKTDTFGVLDRCGARACGAGVVQHQEAIADRRR